MKKRSKETRRKLMLLDVILNLVDAVFCIFVSKNSPSIPDLANFDITAAIGVQEIRDSLPKTQANAKKDTGEQPIYCPFSNF